MKFLILFAVLIGCAFGAPEIVQRFFNEETIERFNGVDGRIVGGQPVPLGVAPYFAFIWSTVHTLNLQCGGSLIANDWVLTAAHCVFEPTAITEVHLGITQRNTLAIWRSGNLRRDQIRVHGRFDFGEEVGVINDIALIRLDNPPYLNNPNIGIIDLPTYAEGSANIVGSVGRAFGFGRDHTGQFSNTLNAVNLTVVGNPICGVIYGFLFNPNTHFCTGNPGAQSICAGDGGGPFVMEVGPGRQVIMGLVSVTVEECALGIPGKFLRIDPYLPWIYGTMDGTWRDSAPKSIALSMALFIGSLLAVFGAK